MYHKIVQKRFLTEETFVLRMERNDIQFRAGQHIIAGLRGEMNQREYSIYSGEQDDYLEILLREVPEGNVSPKLKYCEPGDILDVNGPFGAFTLEAYEISSRKFVFVASGTGISPFHSFVKTYPGLDYALFHGVRFRTEAYEMNDYEPERYFLCTSRESYKGRQGRVTKFLTRYPVDSNMLFYLCGNSNMIYDMFHVLKSKGVAAENIFKEVYF